MIKLWVVVGYISVFHGIFEPKILSGGYDVNRNYYGNSYE